MTRRGESFLLPIVEKCFGSKAFLLCLGCHVTISQKSEEERDIDKLAGGSRDRRHEPCKFDDVAQLGQIADVPLNIDADVRAVSFAQGETLLFFRPRVRDLEVLLIREDFLLVRILFLFYRTFDDEGKAQYVGCQRDYGHHALHGRVGRRRAYRRVHEAVRVKNRDGRELAVILEHREYLGEHAPQIGRAHV